jgi:hypothetical protein
MAICDHALALRRLACAQPCAQLEMHREGAENTNAGEGGQGRRLGRSPTRMPTDFKPRSWRRWGFVPADGLWRVVAARTPGMTAANPPEPAPGAAQGAMLLHCFDEVLATRGLIAAARAEPRTNAVLIASNHPDEREARKGD